MKEMEKPRIQQMLDSYCKGGDDCLHRSLLDPLLKKGAEGKAELCGPERKKGGGQDH